MTREVDIDQVPWYRGTMQTVATNIRFPHDEYQQLKTLAFLEKRPVSQLIRDSIKMYKTQKTSLGGNKRLELFRLMVKSRIKVDVSTLELVADGRRI